MMRKTLVLSATLFATGTYAAGAAADAGWPQAAVQSVASEQCLAGLPQSRATVKSITDGDTIRLQDDRRVRLIGFNTPELNRHNKRDPEPFAAESKNALEQFIPPGSGITLVFGKDIKDRHGRTLAHVLDASGKSAAVHMLESGMAAYSIVAPNSRCAFRDAALEHKARREAAGLWKFTPPWTISAAQLGAGDTGFHIVSGRVSSIKQKGKYHSLDIDNRLRVRIRKSLAKKLPLQDLRGKRVQVRGWLGRHQSTLQVRLYHALNLQVMD